MKTHVIHWKSTVTGGIGTGTKRFEKEEAERLSTELNQDYPEIDHEAVLVVAAPGGIHARTGGEAQPQVDH